MLAVRSAIIPHGLNYLLNPLHPQFNRVRIGPPEPFFFDPRLWKRYPGAIVRRPLSPERADRQAADQVAARGEPEAGDGVLINI